MNRVTTLAFIDELQKISGAGREALKIVGEAAKGVVSKGGKVLAEGWQHMGKAPVAEPWRTVRGHGWIGSGYTPHPEAGIPGKILEGVTSLGGGIPMGGGRRTKGLTAYLPVGQKALLTAGAATQLPGALKKEDPSGKGRSRTERLGGLAAGTATGIATSRLGMVPAIAAGLAGEAAGAGAGRLVRHRKPMPQGTGGYSAPVQQAAPQAPQQAPVPSAGQV